jgi:hypothetical protein
MMMIIGIGLGEIGIRSISGHHHNNFEYHPFDNYEKIS